jgi:hypothetical protein
MPNISHEQAIANLIARYAFLVDDGDFRGLAQLFADGEFILNGRTPAIGSEAVEALAYNFDSTPFRSLLPRWKFRSETHGKQRKIEP